MANSSTRSRGGLLKAIGPGIVFAGAAIGVSHLVQSTRAGAGYGFTLLWAVLAINFIKYPFFEFGQRYASSTGETLLGGYRRVGKWALILFAIISFGSGIPTVAVVTLVTAGLAANVLSGALSVTLWAVLVVCVCLGLLALGGYPWLDKLVKVMMVFLAVSTAVAVIAAIGKASPRAFEFVPVSNWSFPFLIALMGWMPTPVDIAAWPSLWMKERALQTGYRPTMRESLFDFNLGYFATTVMAIMFVSLGALVMYASGAEVETKAVPFAAQLISMYTDALGDWSRPLILTAALTCMFSTTITVIDGYPRVLAESVRVLRGDDETNVRAWYWVLIVLLCGGAIGIIAYFSSKMTLLVDFVTILAFLSAPVLAYINHRTMTLPNLPADAAPPKWLRILSVVGMVFLLCFSGIYLYQFLTRA
ncbi:MAG: divalent metal cation transporter [Planctomycetes bacterium]|nr:divalent metal cation transporter [Planctomycetota bacterium]